MYKMYYSFMKISSWYGQKLVRMEKIIYNVCKLNI